MSDQIKHLSDLIETSRHGVVFTGAGVSTESGIPDFRSPGTGLWTKNQPIPFQDFIASEEVRRETWRRKIQIDKTLANAQPNEGHKAIARLVHSEKADIVITQNIDGLHQASGVPDDKVIELHGNTTYAACLECGERHELEDIMAAFLVDETLPFCRRCGGIVKSATISFGQPMPEDKMRAAQDHAIACDLFLAIGSSLVVYPAAGLPLLAKRHDAKLVIINREPTPFDDAADLVIHAEIGAILCALALEGEGIEGSPSLI